MTQNQMLVVGVVTLSGVIVTLSGVIVWLAKHALKEPSRIKKAEELLHARYADELAERRDVEKRFAEVLFKSLESREGAQGERTTGNSDP